MDSTKAEKIKVIFLGSAGVGKTSIIQLFMYSQFQSDYQTTVGIDFFTKEIQYQGKIVNLQIWDTAGQEQFKSLIPGYIRDAKVVILVYDVSDPKTLTAAKEWFEQVVEIQGSAPITFLVGNKTDLPRNVNDKDVKEVAQDKMTLFETSAKTGENVTKLFTSITESVVAIDTPQEEGNTIQLESKPAEAATKQTSSCGC